MEEQIPVLLTLRFDDQQLQRLRSVSPRFSIRQQSVQQDRDDISSFLHGDEQIVYGMVPPRDLARLPDLKWVQLHSAGINHLNDHPIWKTGIPVTTASGIHAVPIGEFSIALMLALARRIPRMVRFQERAEWPRQRWEQLIGVELHGKTLGVLGYGSIGREAARIGSEGFRMRILATESGGGESRARYYEPGVGDPEGRLPERRYPMDRLRELLVESDFVLLALPLTPATRHVIGEAELRSMKPSAFFVNIARGGLVDEQALVRALKEGWLAGAGLDTFAIEPLPRESQLWHMENVIVAPHIAAATPTYDDRAVALFSENLRRFLDGRPLLNLVDREKGY